MGLEPTTSSLPRKCSTPEPYEHNSSKLFCQYLTTQSILNIILNFESIIVLLLNSSIRDFIESKKYEISSQFKMERETGLEPATLSLEG